MSEHPSNSPNDAAIEALRQGSTSLGKCPLPHALGWLLREQLSGTLSLHLRQLEKSIIVKNGIPVFASSNIAEESLGRVLVNRGDIDEITIYQAVAESIESERYLGEVLVEKKVLSPFELFKAMKRSIGLCILDAFRWHEGELRYDANDPDVSDKILLKVNPSSLIIRGLSAYSPDDPVQKSFCPADDALFQMKANVVETKKLAINAIESRMARTLAKPQTLSALASAANVDDRTAHRFLYAMVLVDAAGSPEAIAADLERRKQEQIEAETKAVEPTLPPLSDEEGQAIDEAYLAIKSKTYFEFFGVDQKANLAEVSREFLDRCQIFSPVAYTHRELGEYEDRLEDLFLLMARAFAVLADLDQRRTYIDRLKAIAERKRTNSAKAKVENPFALKTEMFEAQKHLDNGQRLLAAKEPQKAKEHFEFAVQCEPQNPAALAHLGYCLYLADPRLNVRKAFEYLQKALAVDPAFGETYFLLGRVYEMHKDINQAGRAYGQCLKHAPDHKGARASLNRLRTLVTQKK